jgi:hypothetical protein
MDESFKNKDNRITSKGKYLKQAVKALSIISSFI